MEETTAAGAVPQADAATAATQETPQATETQTEQPQATQVRDVQTAPQEADSKPDFALVKDENGRVRLVEGDKAQPQKQDEPPQAQPQSYTANDLFKDVAMGRVDESRVPQELEGYYEAIKQQRANAMQVIQAQQAQNAQAMQARQIEAEQQAQEAAKNANANNAAVYTRMRDFAEQKALKDLGIESKDALEALEYSDSEEDNAKRRAYDAAVQVNMQQLSAAVAQQQRQVAQVQASSNEITQAILKGAQEYKSKEPNFDKIDQMLSTYYQKLPFEQGARVAQALNRVIGVFGGQKGVYLLPGDAEVLDEYYKVTRKAFYEQQAGVGTTPRPMARPPQVEHTGQVAQSAQPKPDWSKMRGMTPRERRAFLAANLR